LQAKQRKLEQDIDEHQALLQGSANMPFVAISASKARFGPFYRGV
jgi:hypothetical protein